MTESIVTFADEKNKSPSLGCGNIFLQSSRLAPARRSKLDTIK